MIWQVAGIPIHGYGLVVGLALVATTQLILSQVIFFGAQPRRWRWWWSMVLVGALVGARGWHVASQWEWYRAQPVELVMIWQGGLSILGALVGGVVAGVVGAGVAQPHLALAPAGVNKSAIWTTALLSNIKTWFDLAIFGVPAGQALGRVANYLNQELYGVPSSAPWAVFIDESHRLPGFETIATYHPLFLYELFFTGSFALGLWWWRARRSAQLKTIIGTGGLALGYAWYYLIVRFVLDFWRLDKVSLFWGGSGLELGVNQVWLLVLAVVLSVVGLAVRLPKWVQLRAKMCVLIGWLILILGALLGGGLAANLKPAVNQKTAWVKNYQQKEFDHAVVVMQLGDPTSSSDQSSSAQQLGLEIVNTPASITRGLSGRVKLGSDGMLFLLPQPTQAVFWMKEMQFGLDLIWINQDQVVGITAQVSPALPGTPPTELPTYTAPQIVTAVLELPAGQAAQRNIQVGQRLWQVSN